MEWERDEGRERDGNDDEGETLTLLVRTALSNGTYRDGALSLQ